ncbi:MAG: hypothetical protein OEM67_02670 [Thermoleophilia bacterium]|nr:hypothetical protein [Thermoleophilia bacterium]
MSLVPNHLDVDALEPVRLLAVALREVAAEVAALAGGAGPHGGGPAPGAVAGAGAGGRVDDVAVAVRRWSGPLKDRFVALADHEISLTITVRTRLVEEAEAWDLLRVRAIEAGNARLWPEAGPAGPVSCRPR